MSTKTVKGLLKGLRYISKVFDEEDDEPEMQIGYPTDVKHVAHIGSEGHNNNNGPSWMNDFKQNLEDDSSPKLDEDKKTKEGRRNKNKMNVAIPPKDSVNSPAASPNGAKKIRNRRHTSNSSTDSPTGRDSGAHRSSRRSKGSANGTDPTQAGVTKKVRRRKVSSESESTKSKEKNLSIGSEIELAGDELKSQG